MVSLHSTNVVAAKVRARLPASVFQPARGRLLWLPVHWFVVAAGTLAIALTTSLALRLGLSVLLGFSFAGLAFVAHEALHGALCRRRRLRKFVGFAGFLPFCLSPRLWTAWHNRVHHGNTNRIGVDPDALATLEEYRSSRAVRWSSDLQRWTRGVLTLLLGFSVQSTQVLFSARRRGYLPARHCGRALAESFFGWTFWGLVLWAVGPSAFVFSFCIPLAIGNAIVMAHILTNHGLRPADGNNDPLTSSTSVTVPRWFSFWTLDFGYHTEHHLFPAMSHRHGPQVKRVLEELFPERYHELPLLRALFLVCSRPRVLLDAETLIDPHSGATARQYAGRARGGLPGTRGSEVGDGSASEREPLGGRDLPPGSSRQGHSALPSSPPPASAA